MTEKRRPTRAEVPEELTWDLTALFKDRETWLAELGKIMPQTEKLQRYRGNLTQSPKHFMQAFDELEELNIKMVQLRTYASLKRSGDGTDMQNQADMMAFAQVGTAFAAATAFFESEILALEPADFEALVNAPEVLEVKPFLQQVYHMKAHSLGAEAEEVLANLGQLMDAPYNIYLNSKAADMQFEPFVDGEGNVLPNSFALFESKYESQADTTLRRNAYASFVKTLDKYKNTYAAVYAAEVNKQVALRKIRGYESVTDYLLDSQFVTREMYENQLDVIYKELAPHMQKLAKIRQKQLGLDEMRFCDLKAPLPTSYSVPVSVDKVRDIIVNALAVMGDDYVEMLNRAFDERWIDFVDNVGKSTGAFCSSPYGAHPYVLITYTGDMRSAFLLSHELGHAGHFHNANREQRLCNTRPSRYFIEAPSTMNEMLVAQYLLKEDDSPELKKFVIINLMGTYYHNFVTHLLEAEFQRRVYTAAEKGVALTTKMLCNTKLEVIKGFWGDAVVIDDAAGLTWMRQPHYYMGLYPYTYSAGLTISTAVSQAIAKEGQPAVDRWLKVLRSGGTKTPLELAKMAGVDMSSKRQIQEVVAHVGSLIDELGELYEADAK